MVEARHQAELNGITTDKKDERDGLGHRLYRQDSLISTSCCNDSRGYERSTRQQALANGRNVHGPSDIRWLRFGHRRSRLPLVQSEKLHWYGANASGDRLSRNPIDGNFADCCARLPSGHATVARADKDDKFASSFCRSS